MDRWNLGLSFIKVCICISPFFRAGTFEFGPKFVADVFLVLIWAEIV